MGTATTNYLYSGPDIIAEYGSNWVTPQAIYAHGAALDDPLLRFAANDPRYYHGDALGSIVGVSDSSGALMATNRYDAWGAVTAATGATVQYGYTGREPNANGLIYYRARYYDPQIGRFTQPDPQGFVDGINRYAYAMNSPVNYVDPWGTSSGKPTVASNSGGYLGGGSGSWFSGGFAAKGNQLVSGVQDYLVEKNCGVACGLGYAGVTALYETFAKGGLDSADQFSSGNYSGGVLSAATFLFKPAKAVDKLVDVAKVSASFGQIKTALISAQQAYKGSAVVGHALSKHAGRNPDIWAKMTGSMKMWNDQAMKHVRDISKGPGEFQKVTENGISFMEKRLSDGRGMRLNMDSTFKSFID